MQKPNESTDQKKPKLGLSDFIALYQMSMRSFFWKIDGRQGIKELSRAGNNDTFMLCLYFIALLIAYGPIACVFGGILSGKFYMVLPSILYMVILSPIVFNFSRLKYNLSYTKSAWWQNTGLRPSQVKKDRGLYGEYIATMAAEQCLKNNGLSGKVFNNVIVPKKDGDFNEIDLVSVNECGIHVIEAKARGGAFYGSLVGEKWQQVIGGQTNELQNPVVQNQNHINFLQEYLMEALPDNSARLKATFPLNAINVVLFAQVEIEDHLNRQIGPSEAFFGMAEGKDGYQHLQLQKTYNIRFTKEEVAAIVQAIEKISQYSQQQLEQMKQQRAEQNRQGAFRHTVNFYPVQLESPTLDGDLEILDLVCREAGDYRTYQDPDDTLFKAFPASRILEKGAPCRTLEEAQSRVKPSKKLVTLPKQQPQQLSAPEPVKSAPVTPDNALNKAKDGAKPAAPAQKQPIQQQEPEQPEPVEPPEPAAPELAPAAPPVSTPTVRPNSQARPAGQAHRGGQATPAGQAKRK